MNDRRSQSQFGLCSGEAGAHSVQRTHLSPRGLGGRTGYETDRSAGPITMRDGCIKFKSNFQWSTTSRNVKDGNAGHITRESEQVKAFRDTWRDGNHSYLTYLRDRLAVARDLLTDTGSIFVQIPRPARWLAASRIRPRARRIDLPQISVLRDVGSREELDPTYADPNARLFRGKLAPNATRRATGQFDQTNPTHSPRQPEVAAL